MKARLAIILCLLLLVFASCAYAQNEDNVRELFYQGNIYYSDNDLEEAINSYQKALNCGYESGALYYNLANAYFKNSELGKAIICYLRASRLTPNDPDIRSNLAHARSLIQGGMINPRSPWFMRFFLRFTNLFSLNRITSIAISLYLTLCVLIIIGIYLKRYRRFFTSIDIIIAIFLAISILVFGVKFKEQVIERHAIVIKQETDSRFEPLDNATTFFTLYEGEKVQVVTSNGEWFKIRRSDGKQGWVKRSDIELV